MKKTKIWFWVFTVLLSVFMVFSSIPNVASAPEAVAFFRHLGYPGYLLPFLGVAKLLGVLALLVPGFPRLKEWAYAGFVFDLTGAIYSGLSVGDSLIAWLPLLIGYILIAGSYICHHKLMRYGKDQPFVTGTAMAPSVVTR